MSSILSRSVQVTEVGPSMVNGQWSLTHFFLLTFIFTTKRVLKIWHRIIIFLEEQCPSPERQIFHKPTPHTMFCQTRINQLFTMGNGSTW